MSTGNTGTVSTHFNFTLPGYDDDTDIDDLNTNFNIIDTSLYDAVQDIATNTSDISSLQDSVTWQTGSFTPASGVTVYGCNIHKANGTLLVYLNLAFSGSYDDQKTVGTLSVGFRPSGSWVFPIGYLDVSASSGNDRFAQIDPDGTVKVKGPGRRMFVNGWMSL